MPGMRATTIEYDYHRFWIFNECAFRCALLGSLLAGAIASRQMFLHVLPEDPGYGVTLLDAHFYTGGRSVYPCTHGVYLGASTA